MNKINSIVIAVVLVIISFYGGMKYASARSLRGNDSGNLGAAQGRMMQRGFNNQTGLMGGFVAGEVLSKDANSLILKLQNGGSKIILFSDTTQVARLASSTVSEIKIGDRLSATGMANQDGSLTARNINLGDFCRQ